MDPPISLLSTVGGNIEFTTTGYAIIFGVYNNCIKELIQKENSVNINSPHVDCVDS